MRKVKFAFVVFFLLLLVLPWFPLPEVQLLGFEDYRHLEPLTRKTIWNGKFQKAFEAWWIRHFGSRANLLVLKNTLYDNINFGMFHAGYSGKILQGRNGILFERPYVENCFSPISTRIRQHINENVADLVALRDALEHLDVPLLLIMAPNKVAYQMDNLPPVWHFLSKHRKVYDPFRLFDLYSTACEWNGILCVNSPSLLKQFNVEKYAFPDQGAHWTSYAAGIAWQQATRLLHRRQTERFPEVKLKTMSMSTATMFHERDLADLLNIYPPYSLGCRERAVAEYTPEYPSGWRGLSGISLGDSFSFQLSANIALSMYSNVPRFLARDIGIIDHPTFFKHLSKADFFVLTYTELNLCNQRIHDDVELYLKHIKTVLPVGWHDFDTYKHGQWSCDTSCLHFLNIYDCDLQFELSVKEAMSTVGSCAVSINGHFLETLNINKSNLPRKFNVSISKAYLKKGENVIAITVDNATVPASYDHHSEDMRLLGIFCDAFVITPIKM